MSEHATESPTRGHDATATAEAADQHDETRRRPDPVRRATWTVLALCILVFAWYIAADRIAPWTDQARVQGFVVPIAFKVSGRVIAVEIGQDQVVEQGDLLIQIDPVDFELQVQKAEASLARAGQEIGASTEAVAVAEARFAEAQSQREYVDVQAQRYAELAKKGVISKADSDRAYTELQKARAQVRNARAELEKAKEELGASGEDNPRIREAIAELARARRDLESTSLRAPMRGIITNLKIEPGYYATAGQPVMTFISGRDVWIQANLRENSIGRIKPGNPVDIALDVAPGRIFRGRVASIGSAIRQHGDAAIGEAVAIETHSGWLREAQRFPVIIDFADDRAYGLRRVGGQADVQIYTGNHPLLNALGWSWIRLMSLLSYVY